MGNLMIDLTFCVLVCRRLEKRLKNFLEIGFINKNKYKIEIVFLSDDPEKPKFIDENYKWISFEQDHLATRFLKFINQYEINSRWIMQVDDDSATDIDKTIDLLDQFYDYQDPVMLQGSSLFLLKNESGAVVNSTTFMENALQNVIKKMNIKNIFLGTDDINNFQFDPYFNHGWEQTTLSIAAYKKIKQFENTSYFLDLCQKEKTLFTDQPPYALAKIAKIPISEFYYFCPFPIASEFSAINKQGRYSHIHFVMEEWDEIENFKEIIKNKKIFENKTEAENNLENTSLKNTYWEFGCLVDGQKNQYGTLKLNEDGTIDKYKNKNECFWVKKEEKIFFLDEEKQITTIFHKKNKDKYEGNYEHDKNIIHYLEKISITNGCFKILSPAYNGTNTL